MVFLVESHGKKRERGREKDQAQERKEKKNKKKKGKTTKKEGRKALDFLARWNSCLTLEDYQALKVSSCFLKLIFTLPSFIYDNNLC